MASFNQYLSRVDYLISLATRTLETTQHPKKMGISRVDGELFNELRTSSLSFIKNLYGENNPFYQEFDKYSIRPEPSDVEQARGILKGIKSEIDNGWLVTVKGLVSAEIFSDFFEMAEHLLAEKYKDPAAVMIGSVLEENLRQLCNRNSIPISDEKAGKAGKVTAKKADLLNSELAAKSVYNILDQKNVTAWLDLRNKAAHGKYSE